MRTLLMVFSFVSGMLICAGCNQVKAPEELKNLVPVTVTVMDGSQPVEGVAVRLSGKNSQGAFACVGVTDAKGAAVMKSTSGSYTGKGVPAGTYSTVLVKTVELPPDLEPQEEDQNLPPTEAATKQAKRNEFLEKNQVIPKSLTVSSSSPIELTVAAGKGESLTVDLSQHR